MNKEILELKRQAQEVSDIIFQKGKQRVIRSIPVQLQDAFIPVSRGILCFNKIKGKDLMRFVDEYTVTENTNETRFFLPDEKAVVHKFVEDCTKITDWGRK